jgi:hypothetical protein
MGKDPYDAKNWSCGQIIGGCAITGLLVVSIVGSVMDRASKTRELDRLRETILIYRQQPPATKETDVAEKSEAALRTLFALGYTYHEMTQTWKPPAEKQVETTDEVLSHLEDARGLLLREKDNPHKKGRELSITLTQLETAILWRREDLRRR